MISISDTAGQSAYLRAEYLIAVIVPSLLGGGDGKCRVIFVGGVIEVTETEAQRVIEVMNTSAAVLEPRLIAAGVSN